MKRFLSIAEVEALTGLSGRTLRSWCARGRIAGAKQPGGYAGSWLMPTEALVDLGLLDDHAETANLADLNERTDTREN